MVTSGSMLWSSCPVRSVFFFSSRRRHTRCSRDWSSDVCSSDLLGSFSRDGFGGFLPQPPYFSGGPRRGFTLGCPPIGRLHESILVLPHSKKQEGLISPASKAEALRPSRVTHSRHMRLR